MSILKKFDEEYNCIIVGVDEAGRGPLAGPVVAAAVIINEHFEELKEINDSKKLTEKKREKLYDLILKKCFVGIGVATEKEIDEINILNATFLAMRRALEKVENYDIVLVDGNHKIREYNGKQQEIIKGDGKSLSIAAASIIAKVYRDSLMRDLAEKYPEYKFEKHKGYGTKVHREMIGEHGPCEIHRRSFLKKIL
ncbi:MAG: ribonuclease HII [Sebaldella sp.]|nr:ribonuclease HII [Sebaldella sp.]